jgi:hypothetical protein
MPRHQPPLIGNRRIRHPNREEPLMATNPQTDSEVEMDDGDYTVTFSMTLPPPADDEEK